MHLQHINFFISSLFMFCSNPKTRIFAIVASPRFLFCGRDYNLLLRTSLAEIALFVASGANSTTASRKEIRSLCRRQLASSMSSAQEETNREDKIGLGYRYLDGESESDSEDKFSRPLVICGPSGVGKGTIISKFMETTGGSNYFEFSVSHTTRQARPSEINGVHYHFVPSVFQMRLDIDNGKFVEYAQVHGNWYGTSLEAIQQVHEKGKICLLDIDVQGVKSIKKHPTLKANYVFIAPPSLDVLKERLRNRGTENVESLQRRTENALEELEYGSEEKKNFDYFVVNDSVDRACEELKCIVRKMYPRISW